MIPIAIMRNFGVQVALASLAVSGLFLVLILDSSTSGRILVGLGSLAAGAVAVLPTNK